MLNLDDLVIIEYKGTIKEYKRLEALKMYKYAMQHSSGEERERNMDIFLQLMQGNISCTDYVPYHQRTHTK